MGCEAAFSDRAVSLPVIAWTKEDTGSKMLLVLRSHTVIGQILQRPMVTSPTDLSLI